MANISVRGVDEPILDALKQRAAAESISMNTLVVRLLEEAAGVRPQSYGLHEYHDLDDLIGTWTDEEYAEFETSQSIFSQIDPQQWVEQR